MLSVSFVSQLLLLCLFDYGTNGYTLDCSDQQCKNQDIVCSQNEDCLIICNEEQLCHNSTIHCPLNGDCSIECSAWESCQDITINATYSNGNVNVLCSSSTDHCSRMKIFGSILDSNNGDMNILCDGNFQSCFDSEINCPLTGDCSISCHADSGCKSSKIIGPINGNLDINCNGKRSCFGAEINGIHSNEMEINGCIQDESCFDLSIYCPPNTNYTANCFIQGNDNLGSSENGDGLTIYAINSWHDVEFDYSGTYGVYHDGTMFCGYTYDHFCAISGDDWSCTDIYSYCSLLHYEIVTHLFSTQQPEIVTTEPMTTGWVLPDLSKDFEHGMMGMVLVATGLLFIAFGCVLCGFIQKKLHNMGALERKLSHQMHDDNQPNTHHIEAIIHGMKQSFEDSQGNIYHQHGRNNTEMIALRK